MLRFTLSSILLLVGASFGYAQEVTAGIFGVVQDASSAVIPGATIRARNLATGFSRQVISDESGNYSFVLLPIGPYEVSAEAAGFKKAVLADVQLRVNDNRRVVFSMEVGQIAEQVTVEASAVTVNMATGTTSQLLDGKDMVQLPSRGRNVLPFALLMPGVVSTTPYDRRANNSAVNGVRPTHNAWLLDGGYNIDTGGNWGTPLSPNIETVAEFRAIRGNYSAEFGVGGGSQFNVITKGGTNQLHGSVYYFNRNDKYNARNFFLPARAPFRGNDYGFTVGGPVYIPKVYNGKNKTFFFLLLGYIKERRQESFFQIVPTAAFKTGNFSGLGRTLYDPDTGLPFPGNIIPAARLDRNALGYAKMYPEPNFIDATGRNWFALQNRIDDTNEKNFRIDHIFTDKHRVMWRYTPEFRLSNYATSSGFAFLRRQDETPARNMTVNYNATFSPTLIMDFNWVRSHNRIKQFPPDLSGATWGINIPQLFADTESTYPLSSLNLSKVPDRVPTISLTNYAAVAPSSPWSNYQTIYEFRDTFTWIKRAHTIKTGFNYSYEIKFEPTNTDVFGRFTFDGRFTRQPGVATGGDAFADLLLGKAQLYDETNTVAFNDNRRNAFEAFVDDSWKVTRRLTINLGLRYSYFPPAHEPDDRFRVFVPSAYDPSKAVTVNAVGQIPRGTGDRFNGLVNPVKYWQTHKKNFAPRVSFAYDLFGNNRTAVRGGYGMFYSREILGAFILMSGNPPFSELLTIENTSLSSPGGGSARNFDLPITLGSIDTNQLTPYTQQWNINIQHGLTNNMVFEIGYSGTHGIHFMRTQDLNQPLPDPLIAQGLRNANQARPYKGWSIINHREQSYMSNYHGLQMSLNRSFSRGVLFQTAYTWSKAIDNADFTGGIYGFYPNTRDASGERAPASFDATHNFIGSVVWDIPFLKQRKDILGKAFGGWQTSTIYTLRTGLPISPELGRDNAGVGSSVRQRPFASASPVIPHDQRTLAAWFNASVYSAPPLGTFSPVGRNVVRGPGWNQFDATFMKYFRIKEGVRFELRAEAYNLFNHTQFNAVGTVFTTAATFGRITSTRNERNFMLGARIQF
ncbi:MAG TPA: carboxypeptidase regulatory-like domain-containing protein [Bryobacteraceae bacterium]|nr:carboxypeptidase regulatory-like domain-containing protein [Bryobacteraceae bacterium]